MYYEHKTVAFWLKTFHSFFSESFYSINTIMQQVIILNSNGLALPNSHRLLNFELAGVINLI